MAKTVRRKHYVPKWVTQEWVISECGASYRKQLDGAERAAKLRWWHEDKTSWYQVSPPKYFRKCEEARYKTLCNTELQKWEKSNDHEVLIVERLPYHYWD